MNVRCSIRRLFHKGNALLVFRHMYPAVNLSNNYASVTNEATDDLKTNPYYDKYAQKILKFQKASPDEFISRYEDSKKQKAKLKFGSVNEGKFSSISNPKEKLSNQHSGHVKQKVLDDIMKIDLLEDKTSDEITQIWEEYHKKRDGIAAVLPNKLYETMYERGRNYPVFVFPLPRNKGYEFFLCQNAGYEVHFTSLINYQAHKENAPECLTMIHYTDLKSKGIILMRGEYNKDVLDVKEAQCIANQYQLYYGTNNEKRLRMLDRLNYAPHNFKHMDLIAELETLSL